MMPKLAQTQAPSLWMPIGNPPPFEAAPPWLQAKQSEALTSYQKLGLPGVRDEQWRHTNLRSLKNTELKFAQPLSPVQELSETTHPRLVFVDGQFQAQQSNLSGLPNGAIVCNFVTALEKHQDTLENSLNRTLPGIKHGFQLLNSAYFRDGSIVILPNNCELEQPIEIVVQHSHGVAGHARHIVVAGANSKCTIIERHQSAETHCYLNNSITEIIAGDGASIDHYKLHAESEQAFHVGGVFIEQGRNSQVSSHNICTSGRLVRNDVLATLAGMGSHIEMNGLILGSGELHVDNYTEVVHAVPNCSSDEFYKSILNGASRSVFRGRIVVAQDAQHTSADQQNNNLLLSDRAEADSKPQLEIYADDVKCSHGATVGQLDQKSLFYLQSRGISKQAARALLTFAFANEVIERIKVEKIRSEMTRLIAGELDHSLESML